MRELTLGRVAHPEHMRVGDSGRVLMLVDDDTTRRIQQGDPTLGWEGDPRLALYLDVRERTWDLWRLEHDNVYRPTMRLAADVHTAADVVPQMIARLVNTDQRRGVDALEVVLNARRRLEAEQEARRSELNEEFAHRLRHGLHRDGIW